MDTILAISSALLWVAVLFNFFISLALLRRMNALPQIGGQPLEMLKVGQDAPDFAVETLTNDRVQLGNFNGHTIAMVFVSPGCGPCKDVLPKLQELHPQAHKAGVELMVISLADSKETSKLAQDLGFTAPIYAAPYNDNSLGADYKVSSTPSYYLIDQRGKIKGGGLLDDKWQQLVKQWTAA